MSQVCQHLQPVICVQYEVTVVLTSCTTVQERPPALPPAKNLPPGRLRFFTRRSVARLLTQATVPLSLLLALTSAPLQPSTSMMLPTAVSKECLSLLHCQLASDGCLSRASRLPRAYTVP